MVLPFNVAAAIENAVKAAAAQAGFDLAVFAPDVRPADPAHGDFQANGVLAYAKRQKQNPRALAQQLVGLAVPERLEPYSMMRRQVKSHV